ncbi:hypothetical protein [Paraburkholderia humisilvae]|uniref:Phytase-like domain-containing protein n=1 Tax=Paraburkholderia humisilvae TaxID=627669 RepID=A0A6J5CZ10_9BURK|nr:hypothetical protein [Paraburkholderia humisilvae]CAB3745666.1 hypothetical protein LMG29542_00003 [Paraburkholderia humisilvae]
MQSHPRRPIPLRVARAASLSFCTAALAIAGSSAQAQSPSAASASFGSGPASGPFDPTLLVVSRSVYDNQSSNVQVGEVLPPNCAGTQAGCPAGGATSDGTYPFVWNNVIGDPSFGITSRIFLDQITPAGGLVRTLEVPNNLNGGDPKGQLVTSFSSKSELALNLSTDGRSLTFMGYVAPVNTIDASNSNTPGVIDPTDPVGEQFFRAVAHVDREGHFTFTETNAYSGNNGRAAILNDSNGAHVIYTAGNAGNGSNPQPAGVVLGAGAQLIDPSNQPEAQQKPGTPTPVASFSVTQLGAPADKVGKDDNFRGLTVFNNVVYLTKGSGSNGVNTVYFIDTTGKACPSGVGVPSPRAALPTSPLNFNAATLQSTGLPSNMCVLAGFPVTPNKTATTQAFPFGIWFADANTLYVADEGDGFASDATLYTHAAAQTTAGLQKWIFDARAKTWKLAYTLQNGLNLGIAYTVPGYPGGNNIATGLPWSPATDGLRNITGHVGNDGTVTIWAITSTVSGNGDTGADPNRLVAIRDILGNTTARGAGQERFVTLRNAGFAEVLRGVSLAPSENGSQRF